MNISILNYEAGNLASVFNAFYNLGANVKVINDCKELERSDRLVIPGVGSAKNSLEYLRKNNLFDSIKNFMKTGRPIMGICLGLQIFSKHLYEDGKSYGLGFIDAEVKKIFEKNDILLTHVGWNEITANEEIKKVLNIKDRSFFYFCHSYYLQINKNKKLEYSKAFYKKEIPAVIIKENFIGTQFHPEKSQAAGNKLIESFLKI